MALGGRIPIVGGGRHPLAQHLVVALQQRHALDDLLVGVAVVVGSIVGVAVAIVVVADSTVAVGMQIIGRIVHCFGRKGRRKSLD